MTLGVSSTGPISGTNGYFSGNVGIGTDPSATMAKMVIYATGTSQPLRLIQENNWNIVSTDTYSDSNNGYYSLFIARRARGTRASPQFTQNGDIMGSFEARSIGIANSSGPGMRIVAAENHSDTTMGSYLALSSVPLGAKIAQERLRITAGGLVGIGLSTPITALEVSGTVSATRFIGDGSQLTGVVSASDRITSGSTLLVAVSGTGFVSLTQAGTNTGWFDPVRGLVTLGVSATGTVAAINGSFSGPVALNGTSATYRYMRFTTNGSTRWDMGINDTAESGSNAGSDFFINSFNDAGTVTGTPFRIRRDNSTVEVAGTIFARKLSGSGDVLVIGNDSKLVDIDVANTAGLYGTTSSTVGGLKLGSGGGTLFGGNNGIGIGTITPTAPLEVSGTVSATYVKLADNNNLPCTPERYGTIRYSGGRQYTCMPR